MDRDPCRPGLTRPGNAQAGPGEAGGAAQRGVGGVRDVQRAVQGVREQLLPPGVQGAAPGETQRLRAEQVKLSGGLRDGQLDLPSNAT